MVECVSLSLVFGLTALCCIINSDCFKANLCGRLLLVEAEVLSIFKYYVFGKAKMPNETKEKIDENH